MYSFTDEEIETIKSIICEHGSDCPYTDSDKVDELKYKLDLAKRPTAEELAEIEKRRKEFAESDLGKLTIAAFERSNALFLAQQKEWDKDAAFINVSQWGKEDFKIGSTLRIRLPIDYNINNKPKGIRKWLMKIFQGVQKICHFAPTSHTTL